MVERQVVAEQDEPARRAAQQAQQPSDRGQILALDLDQFQLGHFGQHRGMRGLHQAGLAHAPRAPEQRVVGRVAAGELAGVLEQRVARAVDADQQADRHAVHLLDRLQAVGRGVPDEGLGPVDPGRGMGWRADALKRLGDALQQVVGHSPGFAPGSASGASSSSLS